jgi:N-methylhydantoinase A
MAIPLPEGRELTESDLLTLAERFHTAHEADRGFCFRRQEPLLRSLRVVVTGRTASPTNAVAGGTATPDGAGKGSRMAYFGSGYLETPVYDGPALAPGSRIEGPALVEEAFTVVVVAPGQAVTLDAHGSYDLRTR